jgi:hypothetical protein
MGLDSFEMFKRENLTQRYGGAEKRRARGGVLDGGVNPGSMWF